MAILFPRSQPAWLFSEAVPERNNYLPWTDNSVSVVIIFSIDSNWSYMFDYCFCYRKVGKKREKIDDEEIDSCMMKQYQYYWIKINFEEKVTLKPNCMLKFWWNKSIL